MDKQNDFLPKNDDFRKVVKKAKRKTIFRNILISIIVSIIVVYALYAGNQFYLQKKISQESMKESIWHSIKGANITEQGTSYSYSLFSVTAYTSYNKNINGIPVPWVPMEKTHSIFGTEYINRGNISGSGSVHDERIPLYFQSQRVIEFFHPNVQYSKYFDDRELLNNIDDDTFVEMAFSFDKAYSLNEVKNLFKDNIAWYWVDVYDYTELQSDLDENKNISEEMKMTHRDSLISGEEAYGFLNNPDYPNEETFITHLKMLSESGYKGYSESAQTMIQNIKEDGTNELTTDQLKIIGIVVTGTPSELLQYENNTIIKGATLGATVKRY